MAIGNLRYLSSVLNVKMARRKSKNVFVSYSRKDVDFVRLIVKIMRATGAYVFRDVDNIIPGKKWRVIIDENLRSAEVVIVFWSYNAAISDAVRDEYEQAIESGKDVIPVLLDGSPLSASLKEYQYIDFRPIMRKWKPSNHIHAPYRELVSRIFERIRNVA